MNLTKRDGFDIIGVCAIHCYICNELIEDKDLKLDPKTGSIGPCPKCWEIIRDTLKMWEPPQDEDIPEPVETDLWGDDSRGIEESRTDTDE